MKSQFDVCGAPIRIVGRAGAGVVSNRHLLSVQNKLAIKRRIMGFSLPRDN